MSSKLKFVGSKVLVDGEEKNLVVFEMANNHMGSVDHGLRIIREVAEVAKNFDFAYAFKFQYRDLKTFIHPDYQDRMDLKYVKRFSETGLSDEDFLRLKDAVQKEGFITMCTPFDEKSVEKVVEHGYDALKIASASFGDWPLMEKIAGCNLPIVASTGGVAISVVDNVVSFLQNRNKEFALMHCVGEYPTVIDSLQLNQIEFLFDRYGGDIAVGCSTHEEPDNNDAVKMAMAKGAKIIEKHVAIKTDEFDINAYSATPEQVAGWLEAATTAIKACGVSGRRHDFSDKEINDIRQFQEAFSLPEKSRKEIR